MTESPRHFNSLQRIRDLLPTIGAQHLHNNDERGALGYQLPPIITASGEQKQFTIDCMARLASGAMVAFEVDYNYKGTPRAFAKMQQRDAVLAMFGITTIRATPSSVDLWEKDPALFKQEVEYWLSKPLQVIAQ